MTGQSADAFDRVALAMWVSAVNEARRLRVDVSPVVREAAVRVGCHERTVWRWVKREPKGRPSAVLAKDIFKYIRLHDGNLAAAHEASGFEKSLSTFRRAFARLEPPIRAGLLDGQKAVKAHQHYLKIKVSHRNERWEIDHFLTPQWIRHPDTGRLVRPWLTLVVDCFDGTYVGWALTVVENGAADTLSVLSALGVAISRYGAPDCLVYDQGSDFVSPAFTRALHRLRVLPVPLPKETPEGKPFVERAGGVIKTMYYPSRPGYIVPRKRAA